MPIIAPAKLSPAPVRSRTRTWRTPSLTSVTPSGPTTSAPAAPLVTTVGVPQAVAAATAASRLSAPAIRSSSASLGTNTSASRMHSITVSRRRSSPRLMSSTVLVPWALASRISCGMPSWPCR